MSMIESICAAGIFILLVILVWSLTDIQKDEAEDEIKRNREALNNERTKKNN